MPGLVGLQRLKQEDFEFKSSQGYTARPCLKKKKKKKKKKKPGTSGSHL
jgi:hypothetical protein